MCISWISRINTNGKCSRKRGGTRGEGGEGGVGPPGLHGPNQGNQTPDATWSRAGATLQHRAGESRLSAAAEKKSSRRQMVDRNKEFRICWKCARPQDKLIAVPGTQCHCGKIHKRSFMLELTAALGSLHGLLEEEWRGGGGVRSVYSLIRGATKLHFVRFRFSF